MPIASDPGSVGEWSAFAAIVLVLAGLAGYLLRQYRRRARASRVEAEGRLAEIPPEYRVRGEPGWFIAVAFSLALASEVLGAMAWGRLGGLAALTAVVGPSTLASVMNHRDQRREVVAAVRERSARMPTEEFRKLVKALESQWGKPDMRPLRELLPREPDSV